MAPVTKAALVAKAGALLAAARVMLRRWDTTTTLRWLAGSSTTARRVAIDPGRALRAVRVAARVVGGVCLPQAVALTSLLQRGGYEPILVLGCLRAADGTWSAHAWVDVGGTAFQPVVASGHTALAVLSAKGGWVPSAVPTGA